MSDSVYFFDHFVPTEVAPDPGEGASIRYRLGRHGRIGIGFIDEVVSDLLTILDEDNADQGLVGVDRQDWTTIRMLFFRHGGTFTFCSRNYIAGRPNSLTSFLIRSQRVWESRELAKNLSRADSFDSGRPN